MQQIERYGVIALLFMIVTVVTVTMWDGGEDVGTQTAKKTERAAPFTRQEAARTARETPRNDRTRTPALRERQPQTRERTQVPLSGAAGETTLNERPVASMNRSVDRGRAADLPRAQRPGADTARNTRVDDQPVTASNNIRVKEPRWQEEDAKRAADERRFRDTLALVKTNEPQRKESAPAKKSSGGYVVKSGDTLEAIAHRVLGDRTKWRDIAAWNGNLDPRRLRVGQRLALSGDAKVAPKGGTKPAPKSAGAGVALTYTVKKGDMLSAIAQRELGSAKLWPKIAKLNPKIDPDRLKVGDKLKLPFAERSAPASTRLVAQAAPRRDDGRPRVR